MVVEAIQNWLSQKDRAKREKKLEELSWQKVYEYVGKDKIVDFMVSYECKFAGRGSIPVYHDIIDKHNSEIQEHLQHGDKIGLTFYVDEVVTNDKGIVCIKPKASQEFKLVP